MQQESCQHRRFSSTHRAPKRYEVITPVLPYVPFSGLASRVHFQSFRRVTPTDMTRFCRFRVTMRNNSDSRNPPSAPRDTEQTFHRRSVQNLDIWAKKCSGFGHSCPDPGLGGHIWAFRDRKRPFSIRNRPFLVTHEYQRQKSTDFVSEI